MSKMQTMPGLHGNLSCRVYSLLLLAYPEEFRDRFGSQMLQVFRDSYRAEAGEGSLPGFWSRTLADLVLTAAKERIDNSGREDSFMNNLRRDAVAVLGCIGIIAIALVLLTYGRRNEIPSILIFAYALDALVTTGIIGNFIVFLLAKLTKIDPLRAALWTFGIVHAVPVLFLALVVGANDPRFRLGSVVIGYLVSFIFWVAVHWLWRSTAGNQLLSREQ
jgi:hypothetical protein